MENVFRTVPDTNVILASEKTIHPTGPNKEYLNLWYQGYFDLLYSRDTLREYVKKLRDEGIERERIVGLIASFQKLGKLVPIRFYHLPRYPQDSDDVSFVLCADNGKATHLLTYDSHFDPCHLAPSWVACWENKQGTIIIEVYYAGSRENAPY